MLSRQTKLQLSSYSTIYDVVVPKTHKLRILKDKIDFNFVREEVEKKYGSSDKSCDKVWMM